MNVLCEMSNINYLQWQLLFPIDNVDCHSDVKLARYLCVGSFAT